MPIVKQDFTKPSKVVNNVPVIYSPSTESTVVDTKYTPLRSLIQYVEGAPWTVKYFSQILARDSEPRGQDPNQSAIYQSYKKIEGVVIRVQDSMAWSQDEQTKMGDARGSALINSYLIANVGDMFCADVGDGREGVFEIKTSEKRSQLKEAVYLVTYSLAYFSDAQPLRRKDLDNKALQTYFYHRDFLNHGQNPLVIADVHHAVMALEGVYREVIHNYFQWFFSREFSTLMVPGQEGVRVYDHFVTSLILGILESRDDPAMQMVLRMNVDDDNNLRKPQLFSALMQRDASQLRLSNRVMGLASTQSFAYNPVTAGIRYVGLHYIVYPNNVMSTVDDGINFMDWGRYAGFGVTQAPGSSTPAGTLQQILYADELDYAEMSRRLLKPVEMTKSYVLSPDFYDGTTSQSVLELLVNQYLRREQLDARVLLTVLQSYLNWGELERFYYLPICLVLIKSTIHNY